MQRARRTSGFTLVETLVVMAIVALLASLAVPRYFGSVTRAKETGLRHNLAAIRSSIGKFYADKGRYPQRLEELQREQYLREVPLDPVSEERSWLEVPDPAVGGVADIRSTSKESDKSGRQYADY